MVIFQAPNKRLICAAIAYIIEHVSTGPIQQVASGVFLVAIIAWAYGEITQGANWFRKSLGAVVLMFTLFGVAKRFL